MSPRQTLVPPDRPGLVFDPAAHRYWWRRQLVAPTVTQAVGQLAKQGLTRWAAKTTAEAAIARLPELVERRLNIDPAQLVRELAAAPEQARDVGAARGTAVHQAAEALAAGIPIAAHGDDVEPYVDALVAWWKLAEPVPLVVEAPVLGGTAERPAYAGTLDLVVRAPDGSTVLFDLKTSRTVDRFGWSLQLAAYRYAAGIGTPDAPELRALPAVDRTAVLHVTPAGARLLPIDAGAREREAFAALLTLHQYQHPEDSLDG